MRIKRGLTFLGVILSLEGCASVGVMNQTPSRQPAQRAPVSSLTGPATASSPNHLPCMQTSRGCIALNPDVSEESLGKTICVRGYTRTVRPPTSYTNGVKAQLLEQAGLDRSNMGEYELDHIIPLEVGGNPQDLSNLALQPWYGENSAVEKDGLENRLHHLVCKGEIGLVDAQYCIAEDWHACQAAIAARQVLSGGQVVMRAR